MSLFKRKADYNKEAAPPVPEDVPATERLASGTDDAEQSIGAESTSSSMDSGEVQRELRGKMHDLLQVLRAQTPKLDHPHHPSPLSRFSVEGYNTCVWHVEAWLRSQP